MAENDTYKPQESGEKRPKEIGREFDPTQTGGASKGWVLKTVTDTADKDGGKPPVSGIEKEEAGARAKEEINIITADLRMNITADSMNVQTGDVIEVNGIGKSLSGKYFVDKKKYSFGQSGLALTITGIRTGVGKYIKKVSSGQAMSMGDSNVEVRK